MKRISISATALLVLAGSAAQARPVQGGYGFGYNSNRYRTRWSIYTHGLISGGAYYSPYAPAKAGSRLVDSYVRYTPYAFGGGNSGLVSDYGSSYSSGPAPAYFHVLHRSVPPLRNFQLSGTSPSHWRADRVRARKDYAKTVEDRKAERAALARARQERNAIRADNGKEVIAGYLKGNNIDFKMTRMLSISGKIISIDFLLNDGKTILKYWNPAEIPSKAQQHVRQRRVFDKYVELWGASLAKHLQSGGNVHHIISSDRDEILAKVPQCTGLGGIEKVYAGAGTTP